MTRRAKTLTQMLEHMQLERRLGLSETCRIVLFVVTLWTATYIFMRIVPPPARATPQVACT